VLCAIWISMKHLEIETDNCRGILKNGKPYALCLGAGICYGIIPDWKQLTYEILKETINTHITTTEFDNLLQNLGWSLDSILQATLNYVVENGGNVNNFNELIQQKLYTKITTNAARFGLDTKLQKFISDPFNRNSGDLLTCTTSFLVSMAQLPYFRLLNF
jgi:hypothetical protein